MGDLLPRLASLRQVLADLLDAFQVASRTGKSTPVEAAWQRVESGFDALSSPGALSRPATPEERIELAREIAALPRLQAMLHDCAAREQQGVRHLLERVQEARHVLERQKDALEVDHSIDLAG